MNVRLFELRKKLKLSQEAFGEKLGVTGAAISKIESGQRNLTEQMVLAIGRAFNTNEEWLRSGEGEMFESIDIDFYSVFGEKESTMDAMDRAIITQYMKLSPIERDVIKSYIKKVVDKSN